MVEVNNWYLMLHKYRLYKGLFFLCTFYIYFFMKLIKLSCMLVNLLFRNVTSTTQVVRFVWVKMASMSNAVGVGREEN
jgi:hypothetical protein